MDLGFKILDPALIADRWQFKNNFFTLASGALPLADANPRRILIAFHNPSTSVQCFIGTTQDVATSFGWQLGGSSVPVDYAFSYEQFGGLVGLPWFGHTSGFNQQILVQEVIYQPLGG